MKAVIRALGTIAFGLMDTLMSAHQQYLLARERTRAAQDINRLEAQALARRKASRW